MDAVLCIVRCLAASLASTPEVPIAASSPNMKTDIISPCLIALGKERWWREGFSSQGVLGFSYKRLGVCACHLWQFLMIVLSVLEHLRKCRF